ncbi:MAG: hypothetical protein K9K67_07930 [Bacteriovoracaceae bacterium]|nr:hypothetical protein [Bacteriovoracaceae bacterium]
MNKLDKWLFRLSVFLLPMVVGFLTWVNFYEDRISGILRSEGLGQKFFILMCFITIFWILTALYITLKMVLSKVFRELSLRKISGLEERDEREIFMSGEAAKFSFLSTLALICFLTFVSLFRVELKSYPNESIEQQKKGYLKVEMDFAPFAKTIKMNESKNPELKSELLSYSGFPLSRPVLLGLIGLWLVISYRYSMQSQLQENQ